MSVDRTYWRTGAESSPVALQRAEPSPLDQACAAPRRTRTPMIARWAWALPCFVVVGLVVAGLTRHGERGNPDPVAQSRVVQGPVPELELPTRTEPRVTTREERANGHDLADAAHAGGRPTEEPKHGQRPSRAPAAIAASQPVADVPATPAPAVPVVEPEQPPAAEIVPAQDAPSSDFSFAAADR